jgi:fructosamine-3-kinase
LLQSNEYTANWIDFFIEKRLKAQAGLAFYNGEIPRSLYDKFNDLYNKLPELLPSEKPALLHGDLWSGNVIVGSNGHVSLIDPAVYYGNREAEIAFTKLFGGFSSAFYDAYNEAFPLEKGFEERIDIYNLYPLLVHVNLFGSGYING